MNVLERMDALRSPLWDGDEDEWYPFGDHHHKPMPAVDWRPRELAFKGVWRERFREASRGWSIRHLWRNVQSEVVDALRFQIPELEWLKRIGAQS